MLAVKERTNRRRIGSRQAGRSAPGTSSTPTLRLTVPTCMSRRVFSRLLHRLQLTPSFSQHVLSSSSYSPLQIFFMPLKRTKSSASLKRKVVSDDEGEGEDATGQTQTQTDSSTSQLQLQSQSQSSKKAPTVKRAKTNSSFPPTGELPTNKVLPASISFPPRGPDCVRIVAWNVAGLAACQKKVRADSRWAANKFLFNVV